MLASVGSVAVLPEAVLIVSSPTVEVLLVRSGLREGVGGRSSVSTGRLENNRLSPAVEEEGCWLVEVEVVRKTDDINYMAESVASPAPGVDSLVNRAGRRLRSNPMTWLLFSVSVSLSLPLNTSLLNTLKVRLKFSGRV